MLQYPKKLVGLKTKNFKYQYECFKISLLYLIIGVLWIYFSDRMAFLIAPKESIFLMINTYKGWAYVLITSIVLYLLISGLLKKVEKSEQENLYLSFYDVLTGLYNRRYYEMEVKRLDTEKNLPISVIMADVNGLKMINDAFGHQLGDQLLQKAAEAVRKICRTDDIVTRWGGDEFVVLLPNTTYEEAEKVVSRIKDNCNKESVNMVRVSMALGWDTKASMEVDFAEILKNAEDDMYKHKIIQNEGLRGNTPSSRCRLSNLECFL